MGLQGSEQIYLVGFMGAGKTTTGAEMAALMGWRFVDLDEAICRQAGKSIADIFREAGEPVFRRLERDILLSLTSVPHLVVATGGGTYVAEENRNLVEAAGWSVWLQVSLAEAMRRCAGATDRPLWRGRAEIEALYRHRHEYYRCARIHVDSEGISPSRVAGRAMQALRDQGFQVT